MNNSYRGYLVLIFKILIHLNVYDITTNGEKRFDSIHSHKKLTSNRKYYIIA